MKLVVGLLFLGALPALLRAEDRTVILIQQGDTAKALVGNVIRVSGQIPSGQGEVTAKVEGPGKLVATNTVYAMANGRPLIGAQLKEFEVKAEAKGKIKISVIVDNKLAKMKTEKIYTIDVD